MQQTTVLLPTFILIVFSTLVDCFTSPQQVNDDNSIMSKPRLLCLHGKAQTAESFSKKIGGARRKLERVFDLVFLDAPINLEDNEKSNNDSCNNNNAAPIMNTGRAWFLREEIIGGNYRYTELDECIDYVIQHLKDSGPYDGIIGFSQGGTVATALATSGCIPVRAVLTAGAPCVAEAFEAANQKSNDKNSGLLIPKLHLAGETDAMIPTESVAKLSEMGGNGEIVLHEKGHLFPTRAIYVDQMVKFLQTSLH